MYHGHANPPTLISLVRTYSPSPIQIWFTPDPSERQDRVVAPEATLLCISLKKSSPLLVSGVLFVGALAEADVVDTREICRLHVSFLIHLPI